MVRNVIRLYSRAYSGLPREIWMLSFALFVNRFGTMVVPFFALYLTSDLGFQEATAGRILGIYGVGSIIGAYLGGRLTPVFGAVRLQILGLLLSVPLFLIVPVWRSAWAIAASMLLLAVCTDVVRPANATATMHFAPPDLRVRSFGLQRMAVNLGISFGPAIGGFLATISFVWLFLADASTTLLCALTLIWYFGLRRSCPKSSEQTSDATVAKAAGSPLRDPHYVFFLGLMMLAAIVFMQVHSTYPLFLRDHYGLSELAIGLIYAVNTVVIVVFEMLLLDAIRHRSMIRTIGWGGLLSCVGFGILPFGSSVAYCVFSMLIITIGEMLWMPIAMGWVAQRSERGNRSMYMSYTTMTYAVAAIVAPTVGGQIYQYDQDLVWYLSIGIGVVVLAGFYVLDRLLSREESINVDGPAKDEAVSTL